MTCNCYLLCTTVACWFHISSRTSMTVMALLATQPTLWIWSVLTPQRGWQLPILVIHLIADSCGLRPAFLMDQPWVWHHYSPFLWLRPFYPIFQWLEYRLVAVIPFFHMVETIHKLRGIVLVLVTNCHQVWTRDLVCFPFPTGACHVHEGNPMGVSSPASVH